MHLSELAKLNPQKPAVIMGSSGQVLTYEDLNRRSNQGAHLLRSLGLEAGDHIALQVENSINFLVLLWSARRAGLIYTAVSTHLKRDEMVYIIRNCEAKVVIGSKALTDVVSKVREALPEIGSWYMVNGTAPGFTSWELACENLPITAIADEQSGVPMLYSSGTTGQPKGIMPPWQPNQAVGEVSPDIGGLAKLFQFDEHTVYLSPAPLYHAAPLMYNTMVILLGGTTVIMDKFDSERSLALIEQYRVTHSQWVPIMFVRLLQLPAAIRQQYDLLSLKFAIHAAAPCPQDVKRQMIDWWGPVVYEYYSSTEGGGFVALNSQEWLTHPGSVGRAIIGKVHILDDDGNELAPGEIGMIYFSDIRSKFAYYKEPDKTANAYNKDGWMTVGDVGYVDTDGYLYLSDRKDFMIITGGVNVYPQEVENLLLSHPKVADVAVFGIPDAEFGESVKAVVQPLHWHEAGPALEQELIACCRESLSHVKCPKSIDFDQQLPRLENGKLYKKQLRVRYLPSN